jgi:hypothetical protein
MSSSKTLPFPHVELTKVHGKPTAASIKQLKKELYANARSVHCELGGGVNGYLGTVMPNAQYFLRAGAAFVAPVHPGIQVAHAVNATVAQITENNRVYDKAKEDYATYQQVHESLRQLVLTAVDPLYYQSLEDDEFGYADVDTTTIITHLVTTYGTITATDLVSNRNSLADAWNPDDPFENLWKRIRSVRQLATTGGEAISDDATMELTIASLRQAGVYDHAITTWDDKEAADHTWPNFQLHFDKQDKLRLKKLTAAAAGYHGANRATLIPPDTNLPPAPTILPPAPTIAAAAQAVPAHCAGEPLFYCWSHGLGKNPAHTSATCLNQKSTDHDTLATLMDRRGGSEHINCGKSGKPRRPPSS